MEKHSFVMMIDDDQSILSIISRVLELEGCTDASGNVRDVLCRLEEAKPNLVILDIETPELDNPEVMETLKEGSGTPVIMLTTRCAVTTLADALSACTGRHSQKSPQFELRADLLSKLKKLAPGKVEPN